MHANLKGARDSSGPLLSHAREVLGKTVKGLACGVVAKEDAVLEVRSRELIAERRCEPDTRSQNVDDRACMEMAEDALELVAVVS